MADAALTVAECGEKGRVMSSAASKEAPSDNPARLYSYAEIGELADASERQVRRWVERGWISYVQRPQGRRISGQQYLDFIEGRAVEAGE